MALQAPTTPEKTKAPTPGAAPASPGSTEGPEAPDNSGAQVQIERSYTIEQPRMPNTDQAPPPPLEVKSAGNLMLEHISSASPRLPNQFGMPYGNGVLKNGYQAGIHVLPLYIDELERDFGTDIYLKMTYDAACKAADATMRNGILDKPLQIMPGVDPKTEEDQTRVVLGETVATFVKANFDHLGRGFQMTSYEMLEGISMGYKIAEQVYEIKEIVPGNGPQTVLTTLNTKPHEAVSMVVDQYNHVLGYIPRQQGSGFFQHIQVPQDGVIPNLVDPDKVARFTWMMRNDDPRGTSHFRAAYLPWRLKIGLYAAYEAFMARFAQPSAVIELDGMDLDLVTGADGSIAKSPQDIMAALLTALKNWQSGGAMVLPVGKASLIQATTQGEVYLKAFNLCDEQITKSILLQDLATAGAEYGTQALGEVHQDTMGLIISLGKLAYASFVETQIILPLVRYNYGEAGVQVMPRVSFGETEQQDRAGMMSAYATLANAQLLFPSQYNDMYEELHIPLLPEEQISMLEERFSAENDNRINVAHNPGVPGMTNPGDTNGPPQNGGPSQKSPPAKDKDKKPPSKGDKK